MKDKIKQSDFDKYKGELSKEVLVVDRGVTEFEPTKGVQYWHLNYRFLSLSVYFDRFDILANMKEPYFELYDGEDVIRFYEYEVELLIEHVTKLFIEHDKEIDEKPELFL